jgi:prolyl oligopeptidase
MKRFLALLLLCSCAHSPEPAQDPYLWLEEVEGQEALKWVEGQNQETRKYIGESESYKKLENEALQILQAKDKIPSVAIYNKDLVNFWQDEDHSRGILRRTTLNNYKKKDVRWDNILDIDALAKTEKENWIYKGMSCLEPEKRFCLMNLSRGGKDAVVVREFDLKTKKFVIGGFTLPEAKQDLTWVDKDTVLVGTDFGAGTLTESGYARLVKIWKRGTPITEAKLVFEAPTTDVSASSAVLRHNNKQVIVVSRAMDFFNTEDYVFDPKKIEKFLIPKPAGAEIEGFYDGLFIVKLRNPWSFNGTNYPAGSIISMDSQAAGRALKSEDLQLIFAPKENQSISGTVETKTKLVISVLEDVKTRLLVSTLSGGKWQAVSPLPLPNDGLINISTATDDADLFFYYYENFNQPSTVYSYDFKKPELLKSLPARFDAKDVLVEQKFATSRDGTKIPYFLVYKKGTAFDGTAPTLQYGYGGFTVSSTPGYNALVGKLWIEKGGVFVVANIRGGGEYGPKWHQAALKENRQKAYDDFISVSEDLIKNRITSPARLAISGRSNGGLLVGAVMMQRPDLYGAILCGVPLLDMMRYSQLLAGASWMGEYGDPKIALYRRAILKYSPYQNVVPGKTYAPVYIYTSTKDDRVHPGHARKMAAKMKANNQRVTYFENTEGGHAGSANFKQLAMMSALQFQFLFETIAKK